ncbi:MAG: lytic transglycosylase [Ilumatobacteraceae bacterium]|nr:lytic transglycosylase [Ilumatobacteraceae bacterium]
MIQAIAGVDSRIREIRDRITAMGGGSARGAASAAGIGNDNTPAFDPFGAAYQQALQQAAPPTSSATTADGFGDGAGNRVESVPTRVPGRASRSGESGAATSLGAGNGGGSTLDGEQVAELAYNAGFRGDDLVNVVAIAKRESNWKPGAFNGNTGTQDRSYGLMQINMIGGLGPARLQQFGLTSNDQLLDGQTNMNAAFALYSANGNSLSAWGGYKGMSDTFGTDIDAARQVVTEAGLLDAA